NCLVGAGLLCFVACGATMRVPSPAAGIITTIFMRANSIRVAATRVQMLTCNRSCAFCNKNMLHFGLSPGRARRVGELQTILAFAGRLLSNDRARRGDGFRD